MMDFKMKKHRPLMTDPLIIPRVKQYLEDNVHQTYVDVAVMARQLQDRYREYSRRKTAPFRMLVEQAYRTVLHSYGLDSNPSSDENDGNSDLEMMEDENTPANHLNDALTNLYSKNSSEKNISDAAAQNPNSHDNELIDISSDESGDEGVKSLKAVAATGKKPADLVGPLKNLLVTKITKISNNNSNSDSSDPAAAAKKAVVASFGPPIAQLSKKRKLEQGDATVAASKIPALTSGGGSGDGVGGGSTHFQAPASGSGRLKRYKKEIKPRHAYVTFRDVGGMDRILKELCELLFHMKHPEVYHQIGIDPPRGFLLHGPPGCGKTLLAQAIAGQLNIAFIEVPATELIAGVSGESEERIREVFEQAAAFAPCVLFIDEIDAISSNRMNAQKDMERRIVAQLISSLDNLPKFENGEQVLVVGATNRPESLDPALRRVGRFDHEISLGIPDRDEREEILIVICDSMSMDVPMDFSKVAELTPGFVGADLLALASRAASLAIKRAFTNIYRKRQDATAKNIPIVDLIDDPAAETESVKTNGEKEAQPTVAAETVAIDAETDVVKEIPAGEETKATENQKSDSNSSEKKAENDSSSKEAMETKVTAIVENDKAETETKTDQEIEEKAETPKETPNADKSEEKKNEEEVKPDDMEVDLPATEDKTEKIEELKETVAVVESEVEAIDLDDLPDVPGTPTPAPRRKPDLTLFEMLNWLDPDTPAILGNQLEDMCVTLDDFREAVKLVKPSAKREGFITVPDVTWDDIGSLQDVREELKLAVLAPVKFPEKLSILGLNAPSGVLLCGPPGCGKTLLAKAVANEAGINFISVKGPELMNMYVGESERAVRQCFQRARNSQPCVIFFDEFDSLCPKRSDSMDGGSGTRVVNQLLTEMDGIEDRKGVFLMAATNRPDIIDPAVLRPGRLDKVLFIGLPEQKDREEILLALTKKRTKPVLADDVEVSRIAEETKGYTGADLAGLIRQASLMALKDSISIGDTAKNSDLKVYEKHFQTALKMTKPSVSLDDQKIYEKLRLKYASPRMNDVTF